MQLVFTTYPGLMLMLSNGNSQSAELDEEDVNRFFISTLLAFDSVSLAYDNGLEQMVTVIIALPTMYRPRLHQRPPCFERGKKTYLHECLLAKAVNKILNGYEDRHQRFWKEKHVVSDRTGQIRGGRRVS
ncbi:hypothetical protein F2P81_022632 [Scophthalmus maximus]|uniref:Uncharacterized protein n=1 Tax=Scophthalmus maximus TaxID=52904 RepID=A0A6A4S3J6_SCOMX|nr:hypothetical protein F2P81_022632 [Scophthalmus maximus]